MATAQQISWTGRLRALFFVIAAVAAQPSLAQCRQALVLALDVSGSVNETEYAQQLTGLAAALNNPEVRTLILFGAQTPVRLAVFEWSSRNHQYVIQPWVTLDTPAALDGAIARIANHRKVRAGLKTALGTALTFAATMLDDQMECWRRTIDVSGDGINNIGPTPQAVYATPIFADLTVNALVVGDPTSASVEGVGMTTRALQQYYETQVIHGALSFAMIAEGYADYARAMRAKLLRELAIPMLGHATSDGVIKASAP